MAVAVVVSCGSTADCQICHACVAPHTFIYPQVCQQIERYLRFGAQAVLRQQKRWLDRSQKNSAKLSSDGGALQSKVQKNSTWHHIFSSIFSSIFSRCSLCIRRGRRPLVWRIGSDQSLNPGLTPCMPFID